MKSIKISEVVYNKFYNTKLFITNFVVPILIVLGGVALACIAAVALGLTARYFYSNPKIGFTVLGFIVVVVTTIFAVVQFCEPKDSEPDMHGITIPDYKDGVPMKLAYFIREVVQVKGEKNVFNFLLNEHANGNNPYPYYGAKQTEIEYIEQCLVYDYQKCLKDKGIYQDAYNSLTSMFKHKENDLSFSQILI